MNFKRTVKSFKNAFKGIGTVYKSEQSFRIQSLVGLIVLVVTFILPLAAWERVFVLFLIGMVLILELINSVFERLVDSFRPRLHPVVKDIKDIMAATVLLASLLAAMVGIIIFGPHLIEWLS